MTFDRARVGALLDTLRQRHEVHDDSWYTCPKAIIERPNDVEARCSNDAWVKDGACYCGADAHNATLDELAIALGFTPPNDARNDARTTVVI